jgi:hypothetical protein
LAKVTNMHIVVSIRILQKSTYAGFLGVILPYPTEEVV